ncbi:hypothetical protein TNCV_4677301 [Trichonephila clavipes]|nr:hypothetical protein TNCV_4677301 [Trichonephila clavipes]
MLNLVTKQRPAKIENLCFDEVKGEKKPSSYLESGKEVLGGDESSLLHTVTSVAFGGLTDAEDTDNLIQMNKDFINDTTTSGKSMNFFQKYSERIVFSDGLFTFFQIIMLQKYFCSMVECHLP